MKGVEKCMTNIRTQKWNTWNQLTVNDRSNNERGPKKEQKRNERGMKEV